MTANAYWSAFGFHDGDCRFSPLALLNGGVRRAVYERKAWSQYQHTSPKQAWVLSGAASSDSTTMADVSHSDFVAALNTLPDENVFGSLKQASTWIREKFESDILWPQTRSSDGMCGDTRIMANQLPSSWSGAYYIDGQWLVDAGLVETDGTTYWRKNIRFLPHYEGYAMVRKFLDMYLYPSVSICAWMRVADTVNNTITASSDLLALSPNGWWECTYPNPGYTPSHTLYPLTANVPMSTSSGTYASTVSLILDGRDFLRFQADTED